MEEEVWVEFRRSGGYYSVSSLGRMRAEYFYSNGAKCHVKRAVPLMLNPSISKGYLQITPCILGSGVKEKEYVHRIVAECFLSDFTSKSIINHKNGIKWDNRIVNLECITQKQNIQHAVDFGLLKSKKGQEHPRAKFSNEQVFEIIESKLNNKELAALYNVSDSAINAIRTGRQWSSTTGIQYKKRYSILDRETVLKIFSAKGRNIDIAVDNNTCKAVVQAIKSGRTFSAITGKKFQQKYYLKNNL
jgi:hypothetical protein